MSDQTLGQTGTLSKSIAKNSNPAWVSKRNLSRAWKAVRCWSWYNLVGARRGLPGLVDFVLENQFFWAQQVSSELTALGTILVALRPERALEIGTAKGGTLLFLTRLASPHATIASVDLPGGKFGGGYGPSRRWFFQRFARASQQLHLLQGNSHSPEMLNRVKAVLSGQPLDYLFIDGDHTYEGVKRDFEMYGPMVRKGGVIALHDITQHHSRTGCEVSKLWNEVKPGYRHMEIIQDKMQGWAGIGVLYVD